MQPELRLQKVENQDVRISCVVPVYNEDSNIDAFIQHLEPALRQLSKHYEMIFVDDGSHDATMQKLLGHAHNPHIKMLGLSRNFGKEIALTAGIEHANGDVVVMIDADFQHPVESIKTFLQYWADGYDMVYGVRESRDSESWLKRRFAHLFYWMMRKMTNIDMPENAGDFRLMDRSVVDVITQLPERTRFMKGLYAWVGFKRIGVPFAVQDRAAGKSSWRFGRLTELAITGITSFSDVPLRVWSWVGFTISFIALIYAIYIATVTLLYGADLPGFPTLAVAVMFLGGVQLLSVGILGEYIARIFTEVKQRPKYIVEIKKGFE